MGISKDLRKGFKRLGGNHGFTPKPVVVLHADTPEDIAALVKEAQSTLDEAVRLANISGERLAKINEGEAKRTLDESKRELAEDARNTAETQRIANEQTRQSNEQTRGTNEAARQTAENQRKAAEDARALAESARVLAEQARDTAESARALAESGRVSAEAARVLAEQARVVAEQARGTAESARSLAETARAAAETIRQSNEATRQSNEATRQANETARAAAHAAQMDAQATAYTAAEGARDTSYATAEGARDNAFEAKEATRDAANQAALNCAETLSALGPKIGEIASVVGGIEAEMQVDLASGMTWVDVYGVLATGVFEGRTFTETGLGLSYITIDLNNYGGGKLYYSRSILTSESSTSAKASGLAFYNSTPGNDSVITGESEIVLVGSQEGTTPSSIDIPSNAKYARITCVTALKNVFYAYVKAVVATDGLQKDVSDLKDAVAPITEMLFDKQYSATSNVNKKLFDVEIAANKTFTLNVSLSGAQNPTRVILSYNGGDTGHNRLFDSNLAANPYNTDILINKDFEISSIYANFFPADGNGVNVSVTIPKTGVPDVQNWTKGRFHKQGTIAASNYLTLPRNHIQKNNLLTCAINGTIGSISVGVGYHTNAIYGNRDYAALWVEIDTTNIKQYRSYNNDAQLISTNAHGLTLTSHTKVVLDLSVTDGKAMIFTDDGGYYETSLQPAGVGQPFVFNGGSGSITCTLSDYPRELAKKIWLFGDSYISFTATNRWPYYFAQNGHIDWFCNSQPGLSPESAYSDLQNLLTLGHRPKLLVWLLGMNGTTTESQVDGQYVINSSQKQYIDAVVSICNEYDIPLVLGVIPTVPTRQKTGFGIYVKSLGVRYIDFAAAVGTDSSGNWNEGLLSSDGVHPTIAGAKVLASQVYVDCPELAIIG